MLNLPFVTQPSAPSEPATSKKPTDSSKESGGFSDVYEQSAPNDDRPSDDVSEAKSAPTDDADAGPQEAESRPDKEGKQADRGSQESDEDAPTDADFVAVETQEAVEDAPEVALKAGEVKAAKGTTENAAMMKLAPQVGESAAKAKDQAHATAIIKPTEAKPVGGVVPKATDVPQAANPQAGKIVAETAEGLDPMKVTVRSAGNAQGQAQVAQQAVVETTAKETSVREAVKLSAEPEVETPTAQTESPKVPTTSTTQQMQARAIMEQVNAGLQISATKGNEIQFQQSADGFVAAADEANNSTRSIMSASEAASQARLNNSAPNPAYVVKQVADAVKMSDKNLIELAMDPPELGKVRLSMSESQGVMTVSIAAENQATTELMRRHIDMLRKDFLELGYQDVSFSFEQNGSNGQQGADSEQGFGSGSGGNGGQGEQGLMGEPLKQVAQAAAQQTRVTGGLDIRV